MDLGYDVLNPVIDLYKLFLGFGFTVYGIYVTVTDFVIFTIVVSILVLVISTLGPSISAEARESKTKKDKGKKNE